MSKRTPIAIAIGDLHLTLVRPACRTDKNWLDTQADYLKQVQKAANGLSVLCAGDIFDRWNPTPELINFALQHLPEDMICVPGQHDLPNHQTEQMGRSGYGVLVQARKIRNISGSKTGNIGEGFQVLGYGWGQEIREGDVVPARRNIALVHKYVWTKDKGYPGAPEEATIANLKNKFIPFGIAVTGDNHIPFTASAGSCLVYNCGTFIRRKSDEIQHLPGYGIIYSDGTVERKTFDLSKDQFQTVLKDRPETPLNMQAFIAQLEELGESGLNFQETVENYLRKEEIAPEVKKIIYKALETKI